MIVIIAGMQRSGSTFSFNVAREFLEARGNVRTFSENDMRRIQLPDDGSHLVIKTHQPDEAMRSMIANGQARCICTTRKPEDAVASWMRVFNFDLDSSIGVIKSWLAWHIELAPNALNIRYNDIDDRPYDSVRKICRFLCNNTTPFEALRIWWKYRKSAVKRRSEKMLSTDNNITELPFSYYDNRTFFHRHHVGALKSQSATASLTAGQIDTIRASLASYIDERGDYHMIQNEKR